MLIATPERLGFVIDAVASSVSLSAEQIQQLKDLRNSDPTLKDITDPLAFVEAVSKPYETDNPDPQGMIPITTVSPRALWFKLDKLVLPDGKMLGAVITKEALAFDGDAAANQVGAGAYRLYKSQFTADDIDLTLDDSKAITTLLVGKWRVPQETVDSLLTKPDPSWVARIIMPSKLDQTLGVASGVLALEEAAQVITP